MEYTFDEISTPYEFLRVKLDLQRYNYKNRSMFIPALFIKMANFQNHKYMIINN